MIVKNVEFSADRQYSTTDKAERLKQWLEANRNSFPQPITDDLISSMSGNDDIATTIFKILGFSSEPKVLEAQFTRTTNLPTSSRNGVKVADREGTITIDLINEALIEI